MGVIIGARNIRHSPKQFIVCAHTSIISRDPYISLELPYVPLVPNLAYISAKYAQYAELATVIHFLCLVCSAMTWTLTVSYFVPSVYQPTNTTMRIMITNTPRIAAGICHVLPADSERESS